MKILLLLLSLLFSSFSPDTSKINNSYDVYNNQGLHLFIHDNDTPDNYEDDWVYDWEDNRQTLIFNFD